MQRPYMRKKGDEMTICDIRELEYNPYDHYWRRSEGTVFSSRRQEEVSEKDPEYVAWLNDGQLPTAYPKDRHGHESIEELDKVLAPYGLAASTATMEETRRTAYAAEVDGIKESAENYNAEAYAWRLVGNEQQADRAQKRADECYRAYLEVKESIRKRYPDHTSVE